jgi:uncharacterized membrane protein
MAVESDTVRDRGVAQLRERYARGEFSLEEFSERLDHLFAAASDSEVASAVGEPVTASPQSSPRSHSPLEPGAYEALNAQLSPGEHVVWIGKPDPRRHLSPADKFLLPIALLWVAFGMIGIIGSVSSAHVHSRGGAIVTAVWFAVIGVYAGFVRFVVKARRKRRTLYAITDRRVMTLVRRRGGDYVNNGYLKSLPGVNERLRRDGSGSLIFGNPSFRDGLYANSGIGSSWLGAGPLAFYDIRDAAAVARLVRELHDGSPAGPP